MLRAYLKLTKPGVMLGNLITTIAGFLFAADGKINLLLFAATVIGTALVISSACVINNYLDQDIDSKMERTKNRPLISGDVNSAAALVFGIGLGIVGLVIIILWSNWWVAGVGALGFVTYVWLYGVLGKRKSVHGTLVGSLSGAAPILAGYVAVNPGIDLTAVILFLILFFWQMPEFYSISIYRKKEYAAAGVPVSSVVRGVATTKLHIYIYTLLTVASILALALMPLASTMYFIIMLLVSLYWLKVAFEGISTKNDNVWSKRNFQASLVVLVVFSVFISINSYLP
ncbi:MAG: heme o synthase [bacterium]|nr:heme o synthase [bacterium]